MWDNTVPTIKSTIQNIQFCVKYRIKNLIDQDISTRDNDWFASLQLVYVCLCLSSDEPCCFFSVLHIDQVVNWFWCDIYNLTQL